MATEEENTVTEQRLSKKNTLIKAED